MDASHNNITSRSANATTTSRQHRHHRSSPRSNSHNLVRGAPQPTTPRRRESSPPLQQHQRRQYLLDDHQHLQSSSSQQQHPTSSSLVETITAPPEVLDTTEPSSSSTQQQPPPLERRVYNAMLTYATAFSKVMNHTDAAQRQRRMDAAVDEFRAKAHHKEARRGQYLNVLGHSNVQLQQQQQRHSEAQLDATVLEQHQQPSRSSRRDKSRGSGSTGQYHPVVGVAAVATTTTPSSSTNTQDVDEELTASPLPQRPQAHSPHHHRHLDAAAAATSSRRSRQVSSHRSDAHETSQSQSKKSKKKKKSKRLVAKRVVDGEASHRSGGSASPAASSRAASKHPDTQKDSKKRQQAPEQQHQQHKNNKSRGSSPVRAQSATSSKKQQEEDVVVDPATQANKVLKDRLAHLASVLRGPAFSSSSHPTATHLQDSTSSRPSPKLLHSSTSSRPRGSIDHSHSLNHRFSNSSNHIPATTVRDVLRGIIKGYTARRRMCDLSVRFKDRIAYDNAASEMLERMEFTCFTAPQPQSQSTTPPASSSTAPTATTSITINDGGVPQQQQQRNHNQQHKRGSTTSTTAPTANATTARGRSRSQKGRSLDGPHSGNHEHRTSFVDHLISASSTATKQKRNSSAKSNSSPSSPAVVADVGDNDVDDTFKPTWDARPPSLSSSMGEVDLAASHRLHAASLLEQQLQVQPATTVPPVGDDESPSSSYHNVDGNDEGSSPPSPTGSYSVLECGDPWEVLQAATSATLFDPSITTTTPNAPIVNGEDDIQPQPNTTSDEPVVADTADLLQQAGDEAPASPTHTAAEVVEVPLPVEEEPPLATAVSHEPRDIVEPVTDHIIVASEPIAAPIAPSTVPTPAGSINDGAAVGEATQAHPVATSALNTRHSATSGSDANDDNINSSSDSRSSLSSTSASTVDVEEEVPVAMEEPEEDERRPEDAPCEPIHILQKTTPVASSSSSLSTTDVDDEAPTNVLSVVDEQTVSQIADIPPSSSSPSPPSSVTEITTTPQPQHEDNTVTNNTVPTVDARHEDDLESEQEVVVSTPPPPRTQHDQPSPPIVAAEEAVLPQPHPPTPEFIAEEDDEEEERRIQRNKLESESTQPLTNKQQQQQGDGGREAEDAAVALMLRQMCAPAATQPEKMMTDDEVNDVNDDVTTSIPPSPPLFAGGGAIADTWPHSSVSTDATSPPPPPQSCRDGERSSSAVVSSSSQLLLPPPSPLSTHIDSSDTATALPPTILSTSADLRNMLSGSSNDDSGNGPTLTNGFFAHRERRRSSTGLSSRGTVAPVPSGMQRRINGGGCADSPKIHAVTGHTNNNNNNNPPSPPFCGGRRRSSVVHFISDGCEESREFFSSQLQFSELLNTGCGSDVGTAMGINDMEGRRGSSSVFDSEFLPTAETSRLDIQYVPPSAVVPIPENASSDNIGNYHQQHAPLPIKSSSNPLTISQFDDEDTATATTTIPEGDVGDEEKSTFVQYNTDVSPPPPPLPESNGNNSSTSTQHHQQLLDIVPSPASRSASNANLSSLGDHPLHTLDITLAKKPSVLLNSSGSDNDDGDTSAITNKHIRHIILKEEVLTTDATREGGDDSDQLLSVQQTMVYDSPFPPSDRSGGVYSSGDQQDGGGRDSDKSPLPAAVTAAASPTTSPFIPLSPPQYPHQEDQHQHHPKATPPHHNPSAIDIDIESAFADLLVGGSSSISVANIHINDVESLVSGQSTPVLDERSSTPHTSTTSSYHHNMGGVREFGHMFASQHVFNNQGSNNHHLHHHAGDGSNSNSAVQFGALARVPSATNSSFCVEGVDHRHEVNTPWAREEDIEGVAGGGRKYGVGQSTTTPPTTTDGGGGGGIVELYDEGPDSELPSHVDQSMDTGLLSSATGGISTSSYPSATTTSKGRLEAFIRWVAEHKDQELLELSILLIQRTCRNFRGQPLMHRFEILSEVSYHPNHNGKSDNGIPQFEVHSESFVGGLTTLSGTTQQQHQKEQQRCVGVGDSGSLADHHFAAMSNSFSTAIHQQHLITYFSMLVENITSSIVAAVEDRTNTNNNNTTRVDIDLNTSYQTTVSPRGGGGLTPRGGGGVGGESTSGFHSTVPPTIPSPKVGGLLGYDILSDGTHSRPTRSHHVPRIFEAATTTALEITSQVLAVLEVPAIKNMLVLTQQQQQHEGVGGAVGSGGHTNNSGSYSNISGGGGGTVSAAALVAAVDKAIESIVTSTTGSIDGSFTSRVPTSPSSASSPMTDDTTGSAAHFVSVGGAAGPTSTTTTAPPQQLTAALLRDEWASFYRSKQKEVSVSSGGSGAGVGGVRSPRNRRRVVVDPLEVIDAGLVPGEPVDDTRDQFPHVFLVRLLALTVVQQIANVTLLRREGEDAASSTPASTPKSTPTPASNSNNISNQPHYHRPSVPPQKSHQQHYYDNSVAIVDRADPALVAALGMMIRDEEDTATTTTTAILSPTSGDGGGTSGGALGDDSPIIPKNPTPQSPPPPPAPQPTSIPLATLSRLLIRCCSASDPTSTSPDGNGGFRIAAAQRWFPLIKSDENTGVCDREKQVTVGSLLLGDRIMESDGFAMHHLAQSLVDRLETAAIAQVLESQGKSPSLQFSASPPITPRSTSSTTKSMAALYEEGFTNFVIFDKTTKSLGRSITLPLREAVIQETTQYFFLKKKSGGGGTVGGGGAGNASTTSTASEKRASISKITWKGPIYEPEFGSIKHSFRSPPPSLPEYRILLNHILHPAPSSSTTTSYVQSGTNRWLRELCDLVTFCSAVAASLLEMANKAPITATTTTALGNISSSPSLNTTREHLVHMALQDRYRAWRVLSEACTTILGLISSESDTSTSSPDPTRGGSNGGMARGGSNVTKGSRGDNTSRGSAASMSRQQSSQQQNDMEMSGMFDAAHGPKIASNKNKRAPSMELPEFDMLPFVMATTDLDTTNNDFRGGSDVRPLLIASKAMLPPPGKANNNNHLIPSPSSPKQPGVVSSQISRELTDFLHGLLMLVTTARDLQNESQVDIPPLMPNAAHAKGMGIGGSPASPAQSSLLLMNNTHHHHPTTSNNNNAGMLKSTSNTSYLDTSMLHDELSSFVAFGAGDDTKKTAARKKRSTLRRHGSGHGSSTGALLTIRYLKDRTAALQKLYSERLGVVTTLLHINVTPSTSNTTASAAASISAAPEVEFPPNFTPPSTTTIDLSPATMTIFAQKRQLPGGGASKTTTTPAAVSSSPVLSNTSQIATLFQQHISHRSYSNKDGDDNNITGSMVATFVGVYLGRMQVLGSELDEWRYYRPPNSLLPGGGSSSSFANTATNPLSGSSSSSRNRFQQYNNMRAAVGGGGGGGLNSPSSPSMSSGVLHHADTISLPPRTSKHRAYDLSYVSMLLDIATATTTASSTTVTPRSTSPQLGAVRTRSFSPTTTTISGHGGVASSRDVCLSDDSSSQCGGTPQITARPPSPLITASRGASTSSPARSTTTNKPSINNNASTDFPIHGRSTSSMGIIPSFAVTFDSDPVFEGLLIEDAFAAGAGLVLGGGTRFKSGYGGFLTAHGGGGGGNSISSRASRVSSFHRHSRNVSPYRPLSRVHSLHTFDPLGEEASSRSKTVSQDPLSRQDDPQQQQPGEGSLHVGFAASTHEFPHQMAAPPTAGSTTTTTNHQRLPNHNNSASSVTFLLGMSSSSSSKTGTLGGVGSSGVGGFGKYEVSFRDSTSVTGGGGGGVSSPPLQFGGSLTTPTSHALDADGGMGGTSASSPSRFPHHLGGVSSSSAGQIMQAAVVSRLASFAYPTTSFKGATTRVASGDDRQQYTTPPPPQSASTTNAAMMAATMACRRLAACVVGDEYERTQVFTCSISSHVSRPKQFGWGTELGKRSRGVIKGGGPSLEPQSNPHPTSGTGGAPSSSPGSINLATPVLKPRGSISLANNSKGRRPSVSFVSQAVNLARGGSLSLGSSPSTAAGFLSAYPPGMGGGGSVTTPTSSDGPLPVRGTVPFTLSSSSEDHSSNSIQPPRSFDSLAMTTPSNGGGTKTAISGRPGGGGSSGGGKKGRGIGGDIIITITAVCPLVEKALMLVSLEPTANCLIRANWAQILSVREDQEVVVEPSSTFLRVSFGFEHLQSTTTTTTTQSLSPFSAPICADGDEDSRFQAVRAAALAGPFLPLSILLHQSRQNNNKATHSPSPASLLTQSLQHLAISECVRPAHDIHTDGTHFLTHHNNSTSSNNNHNNNHHHHGGGVGGGQTDLVAYFPSCTRYDYTADASVMMMGRDNHILQQITKRRRVMRRRDAAKRFRTYALSATTTTTTSTVATNNGDIPTTTTTVASVATTTGGSPATTAMFGESPFSATSVANAPNHNITTTSGPTSTSPASMLKGPHHHRHNSVHPPVFSIRCCSGGDGADDSMSGSSCESSTDDEDDAAELNAVRTAINAPRPPSFSSGAAFQPGSPSRFSRRGHSSSFALSNTTNNNNNSSFASATTLVAAATSSSFAMNHHHQPTMKVPDFVQFSSTMRVPILMPIGPFERILMTVQSLSSLGGLKSSLADATVRQASSSPNNNPCYQPTSTTPGGGSGIAEGRIFPVPSTVNNNRDYNNNNTTDTSSTQQQQQQQQEPNEKVVESAFKCSDLVGRVIVSAALQRHLREEIDAGVRHTSASALLLLLSGGDINDSPPPSSSSATGVMGEREDAPPATNNNNATTILVSRSPSPKNPRDDGQQQQQAHPTLLSSSPPAQQHHHHDTPSPPLLNNDIQQYNVGFIPGGGTTTTTTVPPPSTSSDENNNNNSSNTSRAVVDMPLFPHSREDMQLLRLVRSFCCLRDSCRGYLLARKRLGITSLSDRRAEYEIKLWDKRNRMAAFLQRLVRKWIATCKVNERRQAVHRWNRYRIASEE